MSFLKINKIKIKCRTFSGMSGKYQFNFGLTFTNIDLDKAKGVCKERSRWRSIVSAYPNGKKA